MLPIEFALLTASKLNIRSMDQVEPLCSTSLILNLVDKAENSSRFSCCIVYVHLSRLSTIGLKER